jgi:hypothetical protein
MPEALQNEFGLGLDSLRAGLEGAQRFTSGAGRHGNF